ncbi:hypothetical protein Hanom_Chr04g00363341 [Helianthus anomalus]
MTDLVVDGVFGDEAEDGEAVVDVVGGVGEGFLGGAAGFGLSRESVEETLGEVFEGFWIPLHGVRHGGGDWRIW